MCEIKKPNGFWTFEQCAEEALKYQTRIDFQMNCISAYNKAYVNNWLDKICHHMIYLNKPSGFWTKENCIKEALKYQTRVDFNINSNGAYDKALRNGWLDEICSHMIKNHRKNRIWIIYSYLFPDNCIYVGLTIDQKTRKCSHFKSKNSSVYKHIIENNFKLNDITYNIEVSNITKENDAKFFENAVLNHYIDCGYKILNINKTGAIGGGILKWNYEKCKIESLKYKNKRQFCIGCGSGYNSAYKNNWLNEFFPKR